MRIRTTLLALGLSLAAVVAVPALAAKTTAAAKKPMTTSQQKMADCSHQSKGMKGDAQKAFMSSCMKGKSDAAADTAKADAAKPAGASKMAAAAAMPNSKMSQQDKMKACNVKAKGLKGTEHKSFMSTCLKG